MAMSKHQLAGSLTLEGKIKLGANKERKQSCWQLAELFNISKTAAANIMKNEASIRKEYEEFKGNLKRKRKGQYNDINEYCTSGLKNVVQQISILTDRC